MKKILVTGFDPFGNESINPSQIAVNQLPDDMNGVTIIKLILPTVMNRSLQLINQAIIEHHPDAVLCIGQAGGRSGLSIERVGININDFRIPDNEGNQAIDTPIFADGPAAYFATLPIKAIVGALRDHNIPAALSNTAGTFICNHVLYGTAYLTQHSYPDIRTGFIHIPYLPEQVVDKPGQPAMDLATMCAGLTIALETIMTVTQDERVSEGTEH